MGSLSPQGYRNPLCVQTCRIRAILLSLPHWRHPPYPQCYHSFFFI
ncbi:unnamed protein product [Spirodela intermedia]|uniref:Uncharacterized protein n=1 Tax=Spirodela intermedia TaxID=51605 RepID=A0A7I8LIX8_SPIIN|nr:unnamed protein product [Spirodela intermedia]